MEHCGSFSRFSYTMNRHKGQWLNSRDASMTLPATKEGNNAICRMRGHGYVLEQPGKVYLRNPDSFVGNNHSALTPADVFGNIHRSEQCHGHDKSVAPSRVEWADFTSTLSNIDSAVRKRCPDVRSRGSFHCVSWCQFHTVA